MLHTALGKQSKGTIVGINFHSDCPLEVEYFINDNFRDKRTVWLKLQQVVKVMFLTYF